MKHFIRFSQMPPNRLDEFEAGVLPRLNNGDYYNYLDDFLPTYPNFNDWLKSKVLPEVVNNPTQREIIFITSIDGKSIVGFVILKNTLVEKKICSFYIAPPFRNTGYGTRLMKKSLRFLKTSTPLFTIPSTGKEMFGGLLKKYNFKYIHEQANCYIDGVDEYIFNGILYTR